MLLFAALCCLAVVDASLFCPHTKEPNVPESYRNYKVQSFPGPSGSSTPPLYKLLPANGSETNGTVRLFTVPKVKSCPEPCLVQLHGFMSVREDTIIYQLSAMSPGSYMKINNTKLGPMYCAAVKDDCGASVPIYRHFQFGAHGIHHAYSFSLTEKIGNFTIEPPPLCYGWPTKTSPTVTKLNPAAAKCSSKLPTLESVRPLNVYDNYESGYMRDHFYSAALPNDFQKTPEMSPFRDYRYKMLDDLGMVVVEPKSSGCACLVKLVQMYDKQDGLFGRRDHKLAIASDESNRPMESYEPTGEVVYCASEEGACGATLPLRKYFDVARMDTMYTVNTTVPPPVSTPYPDRVLCWIWDVEIIAPINRPAQPERKPRVTPSPTCPCSCDSESPKPIMVDKKPYFDAFPTPKPFPAR